MEVIKHGNPDKMNGVITFTCRNCGCIFKAERGEYKHDFCQREGTDWYEVSCPFCHKDVTISDKEVKRQWNGD